MSQISPPLRILLICVVAFLGAWMLFLKPKSGSSSASPSPTPAPNLQTGKPAVSMPGKLAQRAQRAVAQSNAHEDAVDKASGGQGASTRTAHGTQPATTSAAKAAATAAVPAGALRGVPKDVARAVEAGKVVVLGVVATEAKPWRPMADDDRAVRQALRHVNRYHGRVLVKTVPLARLSRYGALVNGLDISQTPSVVVIDHQLHGTVLAGYLDRVSINQAIVDARRASISRLITDPYLRRMNRVCSRYTMLWERFSYPTVRNRWDGWFRRLLRLDRREQREFAALGAPARWRGLQGRVVGAVGADQAYVRRVWAAVKARDAAALQGALDAVDVGSLRRLDRDLDRAGVTSCVFDRRS